MWSLNQKIPGLVLVKPGILALKYGRDMEIEAPNTFTEFIKGKHMDIKLSNRGIFVDETLPYVGASPGRILLCSCWENTCMEIKCSYSVNYAKPCYSNLQYLRLCDRKTFLKNSHKYYTQCMLQMAVTIAIKSCFFVWTPHGMIINEIYFDNKFWYSIKLISKILWAFFFRSSFNG